MAYTVAGAVLPKRGEAPETHVFYKPDENESMSTLQWFGTKDVRVVEAPKPLVTDPEDAIIRITSAAICGSDLHLYLGQMPGMKKGDIMGHENMGIVEAVGPNVRSIKPGDRVVVAFDIACGRCQLCHKKAFSGCDNTNPSQEQEMLYGHHTSGIFGYSHLTGGYPGGQAEFLRVPLADVNCLKVSTEYPDDKVVLLSDILPTAWHANELGEVGEGDNVVIWGAGPVGILAAHCAQARGAARVVLVDQEQYRLDFAKAKYPGIETINFKEVNTKDALHQMFKDETGRYIGPDVGIEAAGFHYTKSWLHWLEMATKVENDPSEILNEIITLVRKGGRIGVVGVYSGFCNHFNIGAFMEKGMSMRAGQCPVQKYWHHLLQLVERGKLDPSRVITHHMPLNEAPKGYHIFNEKEEGCIKVVLKPGAKAMSMSEQ